MGSCFDLVEPHQHGTCSGHVRNGFELARVKTHLTGKYYPYAIILSLLTVPSPMIDTFGTHVT